jgi:carbamate kinase
MKTHKPIAVVAIGGNAITRETQTGTLEEQLTNIETCAPQILSLWEQGYQFVLTHGNGPQVGNILLRGEAARGVVPQMPLDVCGAESQGQLGYLIQQTFRNILKKRKIDKEVISIVTQVIVDEKDPAFQNPTKPIGPFYTKEESERLAKEKNAVMKEDSGRGYRRVVASPKPLHIVETQLIRQMAKKGHLVIAAGGGGVPVIQSGDGTLHGVEAVVDKDWASAILAKGIHADLLVFLTGVPQVAIRFQEPTREWLSKLDVEKTRQYLAEGHFPAGSMGPKIEASLSFLESVPGGRVLITSLDALKDALQGKTGTWIVTKEHPEASCNGC